MPQGAGRIANDKNFAMVALLDAVGNKEWLPPETMTQAEWHKIMKWKDGLIDRPWQEQALYAFAATGPTFGSMWAGAWAKDDKDKPKGTRYRQARDAAIRDREGLRGIDFHFGAFGDLVIPDNSLVYCDPPYAGTTGYAGAVVQIKADDTKTDNKWKPILFWQWADALVDRGCPVFVSEYKGPTTSSFNIPATSEQLEERTAAYAAAKALGYNNPDVSSEVYEAVRARTTAADAAIAGNAQHRIDAWKVVWEKEVVSDFSASRSKENEAKRLDAWRKFLRTTPEWESHKENEAKWFKTQIPSEVKDHTNWPPGTEAPAVMNAGKKEVERLFHRAP